VVLKEKPYSTRAADVDEAHDAADAAGLVLTEGFMWRHSPHALRFVEELPRIGELRTIRSTFSFQIESDDDIRLSRELAGGSLMDVGTYCVNAARMIAGREPLAAVGVAWPAASGVDERFSGILDFGDGVVATLTSGFSSEHSGMEAIGSEGSLWLDDSFQGRATTLIGPDGFVADIPLVNPGRGARDRPTSRRLRPGSAHPSRRSAVALTRRLRQGRRHRATDRSRS
jgi:predicted dehydrogenase